MFNMGIGMVAVVAPQDLESLQDQVAESLFHNWRGGSGQRGEAGVTDGLGEAANPRKARLVVLISGSGSNLQAILDACASGELPAEVTAVVSNKAEAYGLERARRAGVPALAFPKQKGMPRPEYDARLAQLVKSYHPDYVVLAGWMRLLSMNFLGHFPGRVVNLHPALPGTFPGTDAIARAYAAYQKGEIRHTGVMVHLVPDEGVDNGPLLAQEVVPIEAGDTLESLETRIHAVEHRLLVETLRQINFPCLIILRFFCHSARSSFRSPSPVGWVECGVVQHIGRTTNSHSTQHLPDMKK